LIDEDFPRDVGYALARDPRAQRVVLTVDAAWRGEPDVDQVARAVRMGGVLISHNRTERARFRRYLEAERGRTQPLPVNPATTSVLLLPHDPSEERLRTRTTLLLDWYLTLPLPKPPTLVWNDAQQALIGGWQPAGYSANDVRVALGQLPPRR
jgi:hypothetical protein